MIGQVNNLQTINQWWAMDEVPRFIIISGAPGSGRYTLTKQIAKITHSYLVENGLGVDDVREAVKNCYRCAGRTIYLFRNADKMSTAAKNALLKITEEPPRQAHFVVTVQNSENMLETLRSRATAMPMEAYTAEELDIFYHNYTNKMGEEIRRLSDTPGMMLELEKIDYQGLLDFCNTVVENINVVTGVNAFKIGQRIRIKEEGDGWDPDLFFHVLTQVLLQKALDPSRRNKQSALRYSKMLQITRRYYREFNMTGLKKDSTLDMWILAMREVS